MGKITKRVIEGMRPKPSQDVFIWDSELKGFGVRLKPSGAKSYLIQYRNAEGRTRRMVIGDAGTLTPQEARTIGRRKLTEAAEGADPSAERSSLRGAITVAEVCDWYLDQARAGRILGRSRRAIKESTLAMDECRIKMHIKPFIGGRKVRGLTIADIERMQADIASGRTARRGKRQGRGGQARGGPGAAARTVTTLRGLLGHARRWGLIESNPAMGVRQITYQSRTRHLSPGEIAQLGRAMQVAEAEGEHPTALGAIRLLLLTGFRRSEVLGVQRVWLDFDNGCVAFPDTKEGAQVRVLGCSALELVRRLPVVDSSPYVFPADWGDGHFIGLVRVLDRLCRRAKIEGVTPHTLRHTFASVAGNLGFSELTIAALLGHASRGVTQRYVHVDEAVRLAADRVSSEVAALLGEPSMARTLDERQHRMAPAARLVISQPS